MAFDVNLGEATSERPRSVVGGLGVAVVSAFASVTVVSGLKDSLCLAWPTETVSGGLQ